MAPSPFREGLGDVSLKVTAGSPLAEVFLVDHAFALVERSIGDLECTVEPGVYTLKAKLGDATSERLVLLDADSDIDLGPDLRICSAAPIEGTTRARGDDMSKASTDSGRVDAKLGEGAQIYLMARLWTAGTRSSETSGSAPALSLHGSDGAPLAMPPPAPADAGGFTLDTTLEVDPGAYFLRWSDGSGVVAEQSVHAVAGWQIQVFVLEDAAEALEFGRTRVSMLMAREGFNPENEELRLVEEARTALADERKVAADFLDEALLDVRDHPMFGLLGAHLMLIARDSERDAETDRTSGLRDDRPQAPVHFDQQRFDDVVEGLCELLGAGHPDVIALATQTAGRDRSALEPCMAPPLLWRSWVLLIEASNDAPGLVPVDTWRRTRRLLPLRPFLLWSPAESEADVDVQWSEGLALALATAKRRPEERRGDRPLADMLSAAASEASDPGPGGVDAGDETRRRVSRQLLAPRAAIDEVAPGDTT